MSFPFQALLRTSLRKHTQLANLLPMQPTPVRRIDFGHVLMWVGNPPAAPSSRPPSALGPRSLRFNNLNDNAKRALQAAAGNSIKLKL